jgi:hypothetical protein
MLAVEHSRQQHHFTQPFGYDLGFHDSYPDLSMNSYGAFESVHGFALLPYSTYENPSFYMDTPPEGFKSEMQRSSSLTGSLKPASHHSSELPRSTLSSASGHSIPSASSSTVGSPYSGHAHSFSHHESWVNSNEGLGLGSALVNQEAYYQGFVGTDLDSELAFGPHDKLSGDFVGECAKISSTRKRSGSPFPGKFSQSPVPLKSSLASSSTLTIDAILERANSSSATQSPRPLSSSQVTSIDNETSQSLKPTNLFKSPTTPASACPRTPKVATTLPVTISLLADQLSLRPGQTFMPHASTPSRHQAGQFLNHFFAQSSGSFVPPLESSCVFFSPCILFSYHCSYLLTRTFLLGTASVGDEHANKLSLEQIHRLSKRREHR